MTSIWMILALAELIIILVMGIYLYRFASIILDVEDAIEVSLDVLDEKYMNMTKTLEKPIFFDSVEVRQCVSDINECRYSIYQIAKLFTTIGDDSGDQREEEESEG